MNIEIGEYIRTKLGTIGKAIEKYEKYCVISNTRGEIDVPYENITKHSKNIIDLIEVGDYVNGHLVIDVDNINTGTMREVYCEDDKDFGIWNENIETIVTKGQFSNMEYRL